MFTSPAAFFAYGSKYIFDSSANTCRSIPNHRISLLIIHIQKKGLCGTRSASPQCPYDWNYIIFCRATPLVFRVLTVSYDGKHAPASTNHPRRRPSTRRHVRISLSNHAHLPGFPYRSIRRRTHPPYMQDFRDCPEADTALSDFRWMAVRCDTAWIEAIDTLPTRSWF